MGPGSPFPDYVNENELESAVLLEQLSPPTNPPPLFPPKSGCETWSVAWSPDGAYVAWSCGHRIVKLVTWNRYKNTTLAVDNQDDAGETLKQESVTIDCGELVWALAFGSKTAETKPHSTNLNWYQYKHLNDLVLATGLSGGRIRVWDVKTGRLHLELLDHRDVIRWLAFAPDGSQRLVSASRDNTLKVWELQDDGNMSQTLRGTGRWIYACAWSPDARMLCSVGDKRSGSSYQGGNVRLVTSLEVHQGPESCAWSPDGRLLCTVGQKRVVIIWDMDKYKKLRQLEGHLHDVCGCDFSPDGALLATVSYDTRLMLWDPHTGKQLRMLGHLFPSPSPIFAGGSNGSYVRSVSFCHDGRHVATVADDSYLRFWDLLDEDSELPVQVAQVPNALCCSYSSDGAVLAVGTRNGAMSLWMSPMQVSTLQHLCRMAYRRVHSSTDVMSNPVLPHKLRKFLLYQ